MSTQASTKNSTRNFPVPRKVLLVEPPNHLTVGFNATVVVEPLGLEYLAGTLLDTADVMIYDMRVDPKPLAQVVEEFQPDLLGIKEGYTVDVDSVKEIAQEVKTLSPDIPIVVGGHHVSLAPEDAFTPDIDAIVIGDGEQPFRKLVDSLIRGEGLENTVDVIFQPPHV
ncbi:MAG: cobalamin B12-binding domain-containing protein, partial [Chloroflexi bacterium]|nr:cobalamin B12-binding domain-containing protein [Chloroflexota bacterium]